jgi:uncharacterized protein (DUF1015 family)
MESGPRTVPPYVTGPLELSPFRALHLAPRRVGDPASARAFARPYRAVRQRLETWCSRGQASRAVREALFLHEYSDSGLTVRGLVGCLDISHPAATAQQAQVLPHEGVQPRQVGDLAHRMSAMRLNPAPILLVHRGPAGVRDVLARVRETPPAQDYQDHAGQLHRIWPITDPLQLAEIATGLASSRLLVADGHHRYAAYVALHEREPALAHRTGLAMVVDQDDTPLFVGAIHRLFHGTKVPDLAQAAQRSGARVCTIDADRAMAALAPETFVLTDGHDWATVTPEGPADGVVVRFVNQTLVPALSRAPSKVALAHSAAQAMEHVRPGRVTAALLPAVDLDTVMTVVGQGQLLPEKATSFQPKPSLGSFIRLLDE